MKFSNFMRIGLLLGCIIVFFGQKCVIADEFTPPVIDGVPDIVPREISMFNTERGPDYVGRRFKAINRSGSHNILRSVVFRDEVALYKLPARDTSRYQRERLPTFALRYPFLGREQFSDTAGFLQPEFIRDVRTLNDLAGFVTIKNKKDAIEYVRLASSHLTAFYFLPRMEELFCVKKLPDNPPRIINAMGTLDECAKFGLEQPEVKKLKRPEVRIESDTSGSRFKLTTKSAKNKSVVEDNENEVDDDGNEGKGRDRIVFHVTRNVVIDSESGIFRVTEEVGPNGEWSIVGKRLIQPFSEEIRFLLGGRLVTDTTATPPPPEKRKQKEKREEKPEHGLKRK